jgi:transposase
MIPLTVPETRRLVLTIGEPDRQRGFRFGWSRWRRMHQAVAARCHAARCTEKRCQPTTEQWMLPDALARGALTDAEWERVRPVLPPQRPRVGRPRYDHRTILSGILTVVGTDLSWREIPAVYGKWETAYKRYRLWCDEGRWLRIVAALAECKEGEVTL